MHTAMHITSFGEDEQGELYVVGLDGTIARIDTMPASCADLAWPAAGASPDCAFTAP
jgi:hypothetical protein